MFAQFFGAFLLNNKLVSPETLAQAIDDKKNTRMRLGVLAINAGLMTAEQVEHVNVAQQSVDKRFGDLCVDLGYLTADDVDRLLSEQPTDYLLLGQTLVNNGSLSNAEFEAAISAYKAQYQLSDDDISNNQNDKLSAIVKDFYHFNTAENARIYTEYVTLLFKNLIRFIGDDFTPIESSLAKEAEGQYIVCQKLHGKYTAELAIASPRDEYLAFAERFAKEHFTEVDEYVNEVVGEFLNVNNGLFVVNESNQLGIELSLDPQSYYRDTSVGFTQKAFCIPVAFGFGEVEFFISII
ncbi:MAG: chemotaxis protein CheX [Ruminococcus sp.]|nr:chemotaxis protein CheX [Ruminococcus sp.]